MKRHEYSIELATRLCERLAEGETLNNICSGEDMPSKMTVYHWLDRYPEFEEAYNHARRRQADSFADEAISIADDSVKAESTAAVSSARLRSDMRLKLAGKFKPEVYGDRTEVHMNVSVQAQHLHAIADISRDDELPVGIKVADRTRVGEKIVKRALLGAPVPIDFEDVFGD